MEVYGWENRNMVIFQQVMFDYQRVMEYFTDDQP
jgi:hypothetical protein